MSIRWQQIVVITILAGAWPTSVMAAESSGKVDKASSVALKEQAVKEITDRLLKQHVIHQKSQDPKDLEALRSLVKERRAHMEALIEEAPEAFLNEAFSEETLKEMPLELSEDLEAPVATDGMLEVYVEDYFDETPPRSRMIYNLRDRQGKKWELYFVRPRHDLISGVYLNVQGVAIGRRVAIDDQRIFKAKDIRRRGNSDD